MPNVRAYLQAARPLAHVNLALPLAVGEAWAVGSGAPFQLHAALWMHGIALVFQAALLYTNDVGDRNADALHGSPTPFSGGSRVLQQGTLSVQALARAAMVANAVVLVLASVAGTQLHTPLPTLLWGAALVLSWIYSVRPLQLAHRGGGEWVQVLGVGVVLPLIGATSQGFLPSWVEARALIPLACMALGSHILTALPDVQADHLAGKNTWAVRVGETRAAKHALQLLAIATFLTPLMLPQRSPTVWLACEAPAALLLWNGYKLRRGQLEWVPWILVAGSVQVLVQVGWMLALLA